jgi:hypothetical protein
MIVQSPKAQHGCPWATSAAWRCKKAGRCHSLAVHLHDIHCSSHQHPTSPGLTLACAAHSAATTSVPEQVREQSLICLAIRSRHGAASDQPSDPTHFHQKMLCWTSMGGPRALLEQRRQAVRVLAGMQRLWATIPQ